VKSSRAAREAAPDADAAAVADARMPPAVVQMLWAAGFALAAGVRADRWAPLFDCPERSTSPVDFWNKR
jgi:hypothetical protein